jgi:hypothetical protein
VSLLEF